MTEKILYEDGAVIAVLEESPAAIGHVRIMPKQKAAKLGDLPENIVNYLFFTASFTAMSVFETLSSHGTNIIVNEGLDRYGDTVSIHVIPRKTDDGLNFMWEPKQLEDSEMENALERLKDKAFYIGQRKEPTQPVTEEGEVVEELGSLEEGDEEDYQIRQIRRIP